MPSTSNPIEATNTIAVPTTPAPVTTTMITVPQFAWPYLLLRFLEFLENLKDRRDRGKSDDVTEGWILCCVLLALMMAKTVLEP